MYTYISVFSKRFWLAWTRFWMLKNSLCKKIKTQDLFDSKIIEYSESRKKKHHNNYFLFMQHLLFQNIISYFIIIAVEEFQKVRSNLYLQIIQSCNVSSFNLSKVFVHSYVSLKEIFEKISMDLYFKFSCTCWNRIYYFNYIYIYTYISGVAS